MYTYTWTEEPNNIVYPFMNPLPMLMDHLAETDDDLERSLESGFIIMQVNHHHRPPLKGARPTNFPFLFPNHLHPFIHLRRPHLSSLQVQTKRSRLGCPVSSPPFPTTLVGLVVGGRPPCPPCVASSSFPSPSIGSTSRREDEWQI